MKKKIILLPCVYRILGEKRRKTLDMIVLDFEACVDFPLRSQIVDKM